MAAINFPDSPTPGQLFTVGDITWQWDDTDGLWRSLTIGTHATSHEDGGSDEVLLAQSQITNLTTDLAEKASATISVSDKSSSYTIQATDKNSYIRSTDSAITITVPDVLQNGESINFVQAGAGQITFAGSGVTINSVDEKLKTNKQFSGATIAKLGGAYYLIGNLG